jgi:hypothetical protein
MLLHQRSTVTVIVSCSEEDVEAYQAQSGTSDYIFDLEPRDDFADDGSHLNDDTYVDRPVK